MTKVFLDTETTGLDYKRHHVIEVAWAVDDAPVKTLVLPHSVADATPKALEVNRYYERGLDKATIATAEQVEELLSDLQGATLVGANPRFDATMLVNSLELNDEPWHYRLLDLQSFALGILGGEAPYGMAKLFELVREYGYELPRPDHTAAGDVEATRAIYSALVTMRNEDIRDAGTLRRLVSIAMLLWRNTE